MEMNIYKLVTKLFKSLTRNLFLRNRDSFAVGNKAGIGL